MKTMTCRQLAGACDLEFHAETFEEMAEQSKTHAMDQVQNGDEAHTQKMNEMMAMPFQDQLKWYKKAEKEFADLARDN